MTASRESISAISPDGHPGAIARVVNVVVDPRAAFRAIAERPAWLDVLIVVVVMRFASLFAFYRPETTLSKMALSVALQFVTVVPMVVTSATLLWVAGKAWAVRVRWLVALSISTHVLMAYTLLTIAFASAAGALLPADVDVDLRHPPYTNLRSLTGSPTAPVVDRVLSEMDVRVAYVVALVATGLRIVDPIASRPRIAAVLLTCWLARMVISL